jgi:predicted dehydrogenase
MRRSRRDFTKMSAFGLASHWLPRAFAQSAQPAAPGPRRIGYAVIGLGRIATHFLAGTAQSEHSKITALVSGHRDKAERIAAQYGVPLDSTYNYQDFDRIAANPAVDAVYVALPNSMHAEYTIRAARAGKHVLCEKPMDVTSAQCRHMIDACRSARVKLMIAYRLHYEPTHLKALEIIRGGKLGAIQSMDANHGSNMRAGEWRLTKALGGGGPMLDHGVYSLNLSRWLTGEEPSGYQAMISTPDRDGRFTEVEENVQWLTRFPSGALASAAASYGVELGGYWRVHGPWGWLQMTSLTYQGQHLFGRYASERRDGAPWIEVDIPSTEKDPMQFTRQVDHFSDCILHDRTPDTPGEDGLADQLAIEGVYKAIGITL